MRNGVSRLTGLIDTHCHLNLDDLYSDWEAEVAAAQAAGVVRVVVVGIDEPSSVRAVEIAEKCPWAYAVVGLHPNSSEGVKSEALDWIPKLAAEPKVVAIGEIGLDFHWNDASLTSQLFAFEAQLEFARRLSKPVVLHVREAYPAALEFLRSRHDGLCLDFHCFAGTWEEASEAQEWGSYFGFDGPITYKKSEDSRAVAKKLNRERILIETDSPFLAPVPYRGKPNHPAYVTHVNAGLAAALEISEEESARITTENAIRFFGFPDHEAAQ